MEGADSESGGDGQLFDLRRLDNRGEGRPSRRVATYGKLALLKPGSDDTACISCKSRC